MYITLNIGSAGLRLLVVEGKRVTGWAEAPLLPGLVRDGLILDPAAVGKAVNALLEEKRIPPGTRAITCLTGLVFFHRFLTLPRMKPALRDEAIWRAAKKEIPLPLKELYLDWQPLGTRPGEQDYLVVGVSRNLVDAVARTLEATPARLYRMDLKPLALARAADRGEAIIACLEPDYFDIVLVSKGVPEVLYTVSPRWAEATPEDNARQLANELSKAASFYNSNHPREQLGPGTPLLLTGELASAALTGLLRQEVPYPVDPLVPSLPFPDDLPVAKYAACLGLALSATPARAAKDGSARFREININLLSGKYRAARAPSVPAKVWLSVLLFTVAAALLFPLFQLQSQAKLETARLLTGLSRVDGEIYQAQMALKKSEPVETSIRHMTEEAGAREQEQQALLAHRGEFAGYVRAVTGALPPKADFTSIEVTKERITVQGESDSPFSVVSYTRALEARREFAGVRIAEMGEAPVVPDKTGGPATPEQAGRITFSLSITK